ncbi:hypothetical protein ACFRAM_24310 [Paenibacillus sp. NPDC056722]|uniref:hypothetical protein n=1 Tax=Paenibacillus sp. NPDC056722 TaxID=3345924 RepID=UPI00367E80F6
MQTTGNLGLKKPEGTDYVDIADLNGNMDKLDTEVVKLASPTENGRMSAADKAKLNGVAAGANNYVHPNHTGDVTSNGDGVTAIAPGVIVNSDVNAAAGIDASKIGTGVVSNTAFSYLNGVTSGIQGQLNSKETPAGAQAKADAAVAAAKADYIRQPGYAATSGTATAYTAALTPAPTTAPDGFGITIVPHITNGANPTLSVNGLAAAPLKDQKGVAYAIGKLIAGKPYSFRRVGTDFLADSAGGSGNAVAGDIRAGKTAATDAGDITGTLPVQTGGTVTPGPSAIVKAAGIYDTAITVVGVGVPAAKVLSDTTIAGTKGTIPIANPAVSSHWPATQVSYGAYSGDGIPYLYLQAPNGHFLNGVDWVRYREPNFNPAYFRSDVNIFGVQGTMPVQGSYTAATSSGWDGNNLFIRIPWGAYVNASTTGTPEIIVSAALARADVNIQSGNIRNGVWIYGVQGSLQSKLYASGSWATEQYEPQVSGLSFRPKVIVCWTKSYDLKFAVYYMESISTTQFWNNITVTDSLDGVNRYISNDGFKLRAGNGVSYWEAWG